MIQLRTINKHLKPCGMELIKGKGYFYFVSDKYDFRDSMVVVSRLNELTLDDWLNEAVRKLNEVEELTK